MTVAQFVSPLQQFFDANGNPLAGAKVYFFQAGTSTPKAVYQDSAGVTPHPHPAVADASGRLLAYLTEAEGYKVDVFTANDVHAGTPWPVDNVFALGPNPATLLHYGVGDVVCSSGTLDWQPNVTTTFLFHWRVPPRWVPGSAINFRLARRSSEIGTTATMTYTLMRKRNNTPLNNISSGSINFIPSTVDTAEIVLGYTVALIQPGDFLSVNITRVPGGGGGMTVPVAYDGHSFDTTVYFGS